MAEEELGVAALLEVEDVVRAGQPDQLSVITYLAQLYHRLQGEGQQGGVRTRRKGGRRKGAIQSLMSVQARRPVSWHGGMSAGCQPHLLRGTTPSLAPGRSWGSQT